MAKVIREFRDVNNYGKMYKVGEEVEFDAVRTEKLVKLGLVECEVKDLLITDIDLTKQWKNVVSDVKSFTDVEKLKVALETEIKSISPRESVVKAIQERIDELEKQ